MQRIGCRGTRTLAAGVAGLMVLAVTTLCLAADQAGHAGTNPPLNRGLKILYAGRPGSDREKDFVGFLKQHFDVVQTGNAETFKETDAQGFDVTLLDWDWDSWPTRKISDSFSRPIVTLGNLGALLCRNWRLKTAHW